LDKFWAATWPSTPEGYESSVEVVKPFADACGENTGPLLGHIDTGSAAKDLDLMRAVLGDERLNYLGYSYGTELGAAYAEAFPENVGRLVLDGAVDSSLSAEAHEVSQAQGFQKALEAYVQDCLADATCPLKAPASAAMDQIHGLLVSIDNKPLQTGSARLLTVPLALNGLFVTMYEDAAWPMLTQALEGALDGDGAGLLSLSDIYLERGPDGYENNQSEAFLAISCLDSRSAADLPSVEKHAAALKEASPTFGEFWGYGEKTCDVWPYPQVGEPHRVSAPGAAPMIVIGTTGDPATPYAEAQSLASQLESAELLTYRGEGHTAYGRSNACVAGVVDAYFLKGTMPKEGKTC
jgi:pimeloyl-ACP methyl ester carboxylesterase